MDAKAGKGFRYYRLEYGVGFWHGGLTAILPARNLKEATKVFVRMYYTTYKERVYAHKVYARRATDADIVAAKGVGRG